jgi:hypothetical protein
MIEVNWQIIWFIIAKQLLYTALFLHEKSSRVLLPALTSHCPYNQRPI